MKLSAIILFVTLSVSSAFAQWGIYGGQPDTANRWESTVAIGYTTGQMFCSGALISRNQVLTAAHCFTAKLATSGAIFLGVGGAKGWSKTVPVAKVVVAKSYNPRANYDADDFMLLTLKEDVPASVKVIPALSASEAKVLFGQQKFEIVHVGFGEREDKKYGEKYAVAIPGGVTKVFDREFEAGLGDGRGTCYGDSGGPTFAKLPNGQWRAIGVTSRGPEIKPGVCSSANGLYGRVDAAISIFSVSQYRRF